MDGSENLRHDGSEDTTEDWLRSRLTAHAAGVPVPPPDIARIDARRRGIRNRRAGWAVCAVSAVTAGAVVATVALASASDRGTTAVPPAGPTFSAGPTPTATAPPASPAAGTQSPPPSGAAPDVTNPPQSTAPPASPTAPATTRPGNAPADPPAGGDTGGRTAVAACTAGALAVSAAPEPADARPPRHLLITVRNTGGAACELYHYPHVLLGNGRAPAPVIADSDPDPGKPVTLAPGERAYAAMVLNGPMDEYEVKSITLTLHGPARGSTAGGPMNVPMPVPTLYANDFQRVTYWTTAPGLALDFVMSR